MIKIKFLYAVNSSTSKLNLITTALVKKNYIFTNDFNSSHSMTEIIVEFDVFTTLYSISK